MTLTNIPIRFIGGENKSRSRSYSSEETVNLYISTSEDSRTPAALLPWPGEKLFTSGSAITNQRGGHVMKGVLYAVDDQTLYSVSSAGAKTSIGNISGTSRCSFTDDGVNLIIRNGSQTYIYDGSTLSTSSDSDMQEAQTAAYLNSQIIYQGTGAQFLVADANLPDSINSLNIATAEYLPDDLVQLYSFQERLYLGGEESVEPWYNSGTGNPPFDKINNSTSTVGVASPFSMANTETYLYFVGSDNAVYRMSAYQPEQVSPEHICKELRQRDTTNIIGRVAKIEGMNFYILQFPDDDYTIAYCEATGFWNRLSSGTDLGRHVMSDYHYCYGKHLVLVRNSSTIYEWDFDTFDRNGEAIIRQRVSEPINGDKLGAPGARMTASKFTFVIEGGAGNLSFPNPKMMISLSRDGGRTFDDEHWVDMGRQNESDMVANLNIKYSFYDLVIKIRVSDAVFTGLHSASMQARVSGR